MGMLASRKYFSTTELCRTPGHSLVPRWRPAAACSAVPGVCVWRLMDTVSVVIVRAIIAVCRPVCKRTMVR